MSMAIINFILIHSKIEHQEMQVFSNP